MEIIDGSDQFLEAAGQPSELRAQVTRNCSFFLKRKNRFLHYSIEWKKSRSSVTDLHSQKNPDTEESGNGGSARRFRSPEPNGETVPAISGFFPLHSEPQFLPTTPPRIRPATHTRLQTSSWPSRQRLTTSRESSCRMAHDSESAEERREEGLAEDSPENHEDRGSSLLDQLCEGKESVIRVGHGVRRRGRTKRPPPG